MSKSKELLYEQQNSIDDTEQGYEYRDGKGEHMHTLDGKPLLGTSTVVGIISKPLTYWASGLAVGKLGWLNPKENNLDIRLNHVTPYLEEIRQMSTVDFIDRLDEAYKAHSVKLKDSASTGTDMHAELEIYIKECMKNGGTPQVVTTDFAPVNIFQDWAIKEVEYFVWSEANCYSRELWLGGISDVGAMLKDGRTVIIDFKSSKEAYESQFIQGALYAIQVEENGLMDSKGKVWKKLENKINGVIIFPFGAKKPEPAYRWNMDELKEAGKACVCLYKINNK